MGPRRADRYWQEAISPLLRRGLGRAGLKDGGYLAHRTIRVLAAFFAASAPNFLREILLGKTTPTKTTTCEYGDEKAALAFI